MNIKSDNRLILLTVLSMTYITVKLLCNLLYLKHISVNAFNTDIIFTGSALFYSSIYILNDAIAFIYSRKIAIIVIVSGVILDGIYSGVFYLITQLHEPLTLSSAEIINNKAVNIISISIVRLYLYGALASLAATITELFLFVFLMTKINNFIISTVLSTIVVLLFHNLITDGVMLHGMINKWNIIFTNFVFNVVIIFIYSILISFCVNTLKKYKLLNM